MSNFETVKNSTSLKAFAETHLDVSPNDRRKFICPNCASGGHGTAKSDSALSIKGETWHCFSCQAGGDVFDLAGYVFNTDDKNRQLEEVARWAGIALERTAQPAAVTNPIKAKPAAANQAQAVQGTEEGRRAAHLYIEKAKQHLQDPEAVTYLQQRGYTVQDAESAGMGYDPQNRAVVFPYRGHDYYQRRYIDKGTKDGGKAYKPPSDEVGAEPIYNSPALETEQGFVFAVEGPFDALAILTAGYANVVAVGGTGTRRLVSTLQNMMKPPHVVIVPDADEPGLASCASFKRQLAEAGLEHHVWEWWSGTDGLSDIDEYRKANPEAFKAVLSTEAGITKELIEESQDNALESSLATLKVVSTEQTAYNILAGEGAINRTPTGFASLDKALRGGLPAGLVTLGAISSTGKTTFCLQLADQIAASGRDVLFVSIEQSARELVAKSLSRYTWYTDKRSASSHSDIDDPTAREQWDKRKEACFNAAFNAYYAQVVPHIHFLEGLEQPTVSDVRAIAETFCAHGKDAPVVFVDYLQLLAPLNERDDDKRATDKNVLALRLMAKELKTPVVCISSLNRSSYAGVVKLDAFKESGAIEYSSDLLLGWQPRNMGAELEGLSEGKQKAEANRLMLEHKNELVREVELTILKNRSGRVPQEGLPFAYNTVYDVLSESMDEVRFPNR